MRSFKYIFFILLSLNLVHCSNSVDGSLFNSINAQNCLDSKDSLCFSENKDKLTLDTSIRTLYLKPNQVEFNIGGECNEGGFPTNRIDWHFMEESTKTVVVNSLGVINPSHVCGSPSALSQTDNSYSDGLGNIPGVCINGRYNIKIRIPAAITYSHDLFLCISGGKDGSYQMSGSSLNINVESGI
ncbi:MAG: hypothetical protein H6625_08245 [Bdellovibrionaceae bacterium]|nr:hypothetical protein [Pseudobdellovibrionaceae bacterium]